MKPKQQPETPECGRINFGQFEPDCPDADIGVHEPGCPNAPTAPTLEPKCRHCGAGPYHPRHIPGLGKNHEFEPIE